jgi:bifunctional DNA-binding transcriptional regulator/antitoxin component of YhaV-PrlF toxin-antitoxin module
MSYAYKPPSRGTQTGRVWEIAERVTKRKGRAAQRAEVISEYVAEGGNENTASTQFHHWKKHRESAGSPPPQKQYVSLTVKEGGRVVLPAELRALLGVDEGGRLQGVFADGELRLVSQETAVRRAQHAVRALVPSGVSLVDELLQERKAESRKERGN